MAGVPGLRCPECGREAAREAHLTRTRRRWPGAMVWALVMVLGYGGIVTPRVSRHGIEGVVPTTALVWWARASDGPDARSVLDGTKTPSWNGIAPVARALLWRERLQVEAWRRVLAGEAWAWQSRALIERWLKAKGSSIERLVEVPRRWRTGEAVMVRFVQRGTPPEVTGIAFGPSMPVLGPSPIPPPGVPPPPGSPRPLVGPTRSPNARDLSARVEVVTLRPGTASSPAQLKIRDALEIELGGARVPVGKLGASIDGYERGAVLERVNDRATNEIVCEALNPRVVVVGSERFVVVSRRSEAKIWESADIEVGVKLRMMLDGRLLGTGSAATDHITAGIHDYIEVPWTWEAGGMEAMLASPEKAKIELTGDPEAMEEQYMNDPFELRPAAWAGKFQVRVRFNSLRARQP